MKLRHRFLLIGLGLIIFSIVAPALVLFARGYKIDLKTRQLVKTGTLVIKTDPSKAEVFLNEINSHDPTGSTIRFILPGDYNVTLRKTDYQDWTKRLNIKSEIVTWANLDREFIALFLKEPKQTSMLDIRSVYRNPKNNSLIFATAEGLTKLEDNNRLSKISSFETAGQLAGLEDALANDSLFYLIGLSQPLPASLIDIAAADQIEANDSYLAILTNGRINVYTSQNQLAYSAEGVSGYTLDNDDLWLIQNQSLLRVDLRRTATTLVLAEVAGGNFKIIRGSGNTFVRAGDALYVLNEKLDFIYNNAAYAYWSDRAGQLVYGNDHEIFLFDPRGQHNTLILRSSSEISQPVVNRETGYVFFANEGKIKAIEIDGRDHRNIYTLTGSGDGFLVSEDGKTLHVYGQGQLKTYLIR